MVRGAALLAMGGFAVSLMGQQGAGPTTPTLRTVTKLVVVDVTVTDSQHHPVHGLKREDFTLLEDGRAQTVKSFEEHSGLEPVKVNPLPPLPPNTFSNRPATDGAGPLNILLLDNLDTQPHDLVRLRQELLKYIDRAKPGTRMALFELNHKLKLLQGFTDDKAKLRGALGKALPSSPHPDPSLWVNDGPTGNDDSPGLIEISNAWRTDAEVMRELARYGAGLPGRKNLLWFSGYFPMYFLLRPLPVGGDPMMRCKACDGSVIQEFRQAADMLAASEVAMYPIHVNGLGMPPDPDAEMDRTEVAAMTGGRTFYNQNYMDQIAETAIDDGSSYYTIAYSPSDTKWDGAYRKIVVKTGRPGLELHYRQGFYADDPGAPVKVVGRAAEKANKNAPKMGAEAAAATTALKSSLEYGAPEATQIEFTVKVSPVGDGKERELAQGNQANTGVKGPYQRYALEFLVDPRAVADQTHHATVEFVTFVYGKDGALVNTVGMTVKAEIPAAALAEGSRQRMPAHAEVSVPAKGDYLLRFAVHDLESDRVGSLETALSAVKLTP